MQRRRNALLPLQLRSKQENHARAVYGWKFPVLSIMSINEVEGRSAVGEFRVTCYLLYQQQVGVCVLIVAFSLFNRHQ